MKHNDNMIVLSILSHINKNGGVTLDFDNITWGYLLALQVNWRIHGKNARLHASWNIIKFYQPLS